LSNLSTIVAPKHHETIDEYPVEIIVEFKNEARPETFKAWLNLREITHKFEPIENGVRALVASEDGLKIKTKARRFKGHKTNILVTSIRGPKKKGDIDLRAFFVIGKPRNHPPVADAGHDRKAFVTERVRLNGWRSRDVDGNPLTYSWSISAMPEWSGAVLSDPDAVDPTFLVDRPGTYAIDLVVHDGELASEPDTVRIGTKNSRPKADAGADQTAPVGQSVRLDGSGSTDVDGDLLAYDWFFSSLPEGSNAEISDPTALKPTFAVDLPGTYVVKLKVYDGSVESKPDKVRINTENSRPVADAGADQTVSVGQTVQLDGTGSHDADGDPLTYKWHLFSYSKKKYAKLSDPRVINPTFMVKRPGTYIAKLIVSDGKLHSAPDMVVISTKRSRPVADAGLDQEAFVTDTVQLDGSGSSDADGDPLAYVWSFVSVPEESDVTLSDPTAVDPTFVVDVRDTYVVQLMVIDGKHVSAPDTMTISTLNSPPVVTDDNASTDEDTPVATGNVLANDFDVDGDRIELAGFTQASHGTVADNGDGSFTYTPTPDFNGMDSFRYTVSDGLGGIAEASVIITVHPVNDLPVAVDDAAATNEDTAVDINLVANDTDVDKDALAVADITQGVSGSAAINPDGTVQYTPNPDFNGQDSFTYTVSDGNGGTDEASVIITVNPVNDPPIANPLSTATAEDLSLAIVLTGSDVEGSPLTYSVASQPAHGALSGTPPNLTYSPDPNYNGPDAFTCMANDGLLNSTPATITIMVAAINDLPRANDDTPSTNEDASIDIDVLANDTDVDGDSLKVTEVTQGTHGSVSVNPTDTLSYTPNPDFNGQDSFKYTVSDGNDGTAEASVLITINPVNDAPTASGKSVTTDEDTTLAITLTGSDIDDDPLTYTLAADPAHGTLSGTPPNVTYTPDLNYNGTDSFTFTANDGTVNSPEATISIEVRPVNDTPTADPKSVSLDEDSSLSIVLTGSDIDGDPLTYAVLADPAHGTLTGTPPNLTYLPETNYYGPDTFTFTANDGTVDSETAEVSITVSSVNDPPTADPGPDQTHTMPPGQTRMDVTLDGTGSDDIDGAIAGYQWTGTPDPEDAARPTVTLVAGTHTFSLIVTDDNGATSQSESVTITIFPLASIAVSPPSVTLTDPDASQQLTVTGTWSDGSQQNITAANSGTTYASNSPAVALVSPGGLVTPGESNGTAIITATNTGISGSTSVEVSIDFNLPVVTITAPKNGAALTGTPVTVVGTIEDKSPIQSAFVNNTPLTLSDINFSAQLDLAEGPNPITVTATDSFGNVGSDSISVIGVVEAQDTTAPVVTITSPSEGAQLTQTPVAVSGTVQDASPITSLTINGLTAVLSNSLFNLDLNLVEGTNTIIATAKDEHENTGSANVSVTLDTAPPALAVESIPLLTNQNELTVRGISEPEATIAVVGGTAPVSGSTDQASGEFGIPVELHPNTHNTLSVTATDPRGNTGQPRILETEQDAALPQVSAVTPATDTTAASQNVACRVTFSEPVKAATVNLGASFQITSGGAGVNGSLTLSRENQVVSFVPDSALPLGSRVDLLLTTAITDLAGNQMEAPFASHFFIPQEIGAGVVTGEVYDDTKGLLLAGAIGKLVASNGIPQGEDGPGMVTGEDGLFTLGVSPGTHTILISRDGYTSVERQIEVAGNLSATLLDARLTPLDDKLNQVSGVAGGTAGSAEGDVTITFPEGSGTSDIELRITRVSPQGLRSPLPLGWSPVTTVDLTTNVRELRNPATLIIPTSADRTGQWTLTAVQWDGDSSAWQVIAESVQPGDEPQIELPIARLDQVSLVVPDQDPTAPPAPRLGNFLEGVAPVAYPQGITGDGMVVPAVVMAGEKVHAQAMAGLNLSEALPSGSLFEARVMENYTLRSNEEIISRPFVQDFHFYNWPDDDDPLTLSVEFPVTPTRQFGLGVLSLGKVDLYIRQPQVVAADMAGPAGGEILTDEGLGISIPPGSLERNTSFHASPVPDIQFGVPIPEGLTYLGGFTIDFGGIPLLTPVDVTLPPISDSITLPPEPSIVMARVEAFKDVPGLYFAGFGQIVDTNRVKSLREQTGLTLSGIDQAGQYGFFLLADPVGFIQGTVYDVNSQPSTNAIVSTAAFPFLTGVDEQGSYIQIGTVGEVNLIAENPETGDQGTAPGTIASADEIIDLDISIQQTPPHVVSVTPEDGATDVPVTTSISVTFSEPVTGVNEDTFQLRDASDNPLTGNFAIADGGRSATFYPAASLASESSYTLHLSESIQDSAGYNLAGFTPVSFTTQDLTPPVSQGELSLSMPDDNGFTTVTGTPGTAEPNSIVYIINNTSGMVVTVSIPSADDGSFSEQILTDINDEIIITIVDASGNSTTLNPGPFQDETTGAVVIGPKGGTVKGEGGIEINIPAGALPYATTVKVEPVDDPFELPDDIQNDPDLAQAFDDNYEVVSAVKIDTDGVQFNYGVDLSVPAPSGYTVGDTFIVVQDEEIELGGEHYNIDTDELVENETSIVSRFKVIDVATIKEIDGEMRLTTASPPFPGFLASPAAIPFLIVRYFAPKVTIGVLSGKVIRKVTEISGKVVEHPVAGAVVRLLGSQVVPVYFAETNADGEFVIPAITTMGLFDPKRQLPIMVTDPLSGITQQRMVPIIQSPKTYPEWNIINAVVLETPFYLYSKEEIREDNTPPNIDITFVADTLVDDVMENNHDLYININVTDNKDKNPYIKEIIINNKSTHVGVPNFYQHVIQKIESGIYFIEVIASDNSPTSDDASEQRYILVKKPGGIPGAVEGPPELLSYDLDYADDQQSVDIDTSITINFNEPLLSATINQDNLIVKDFNRFRITDDVLNDLKSEGVPDHVLQQLETIKNQSPIGKKDFNDILITLIGPAETKTYESVIQKHASVPIEGSFVFTNYNSTVTFVPSTRLRYGNDYEIAITLGGPNGIKDTEGKPVDPQLNTLSFTTISPEIIGQYTSMRNAKDIAVDESFAYVTDTDQSDKTGLTIIDFSDPTIDPLKSLPYGEVRLREDHYSSWAVKINSDYVYIITVGKVIPGTFTLLSTLQIWDVNKGNRLNPTRVEPSQGDKVIPLTTATTLAGVVPSRLVVSEGFAFFAMMNHGIKIMDVHDPSSPVAISDIRCSVTFKITDASINDLEAAGLPPLIIASLQSIKNTVYRGQKRFLDAVRAVIGDTSTETYKALLLRYAEIDADPPGSASDIDVRGDLAYLANGQTGELIIVKFTDDQGIIGDEWTEVNRVNIPSNAPGRPLNAYRVEVIENLRVKDDTDPTGFDYLNLALVGCLEQGLAIVDVTDPANPDYLYTLDNIGRVTGLDVNKDAGIVVLSDSDGEMRIVNIKNLNLQDLSSTFFELGSVDLGGPAKGGIDLEDNRAYVTIENGVKAIEIPLADAGCSVKLIYIEDGEHKLPLLPGESVVAKAVTDPVGRTVTWSIVEREPGVKASIDPSTGVITAEEETESGWIKIRAEDSENDACFKEERLYVGCSQCDQSDAQYCQVQEGGGSCTLSSVDVRISLGRARGGQSAGDFFIRSEKPSVDLASPKALEFSSLARNVMALRESDGTLRQVLAPRSLANIVVINDFSYEIEFYRPDEITGRTNNLYEIDPSATPFAIWTVENPDASSEVYNRLKITEMRGDTSKAYEYVWNQAQNAWSLIRGNGLRIETRAEVQDGENNNRIVTHTIKDASNNIASIVETTYHEYSLGQETVEEIIKQIDDPDGAALTTTTTYYEDPNETGSYLKIRSRVNPDGSWARYEYDEHGRKTAEVRSWLDVSMDSAPSSARAIYYDYTPVDERDSGTPVDVRRPRTVTEKIQGTTVSKTYYAYLTNEDRERTEIIEHCVNPASVYGDSGNLRTVNTYYPFGTEKADSGRIRSLRYPDGRLDTHSYEYGTYSSVEGGFSPGSGSGMRQNVVHGTTERPEGIAYKTTKEASVRDEFGNVLLRETYVYDGSGYVRIQWTEQYFDEFGRVETIKHSNGTQADSTWSCCARESEKDTRGIERTYIYDDLQRLETEIKEGIEQGPWPAQSDISTTYTYDAAGRRLTETVSAGGLSLSTINQYDLAGRLRRSTDSANLVTSYDYEQGGRVTTVTLPGGATEVTTRYLDGRVRSVTGTGVFSKYYEYGVNPDGTQWTKVSVARADSPRWEKTTMDMLGRTIRIEKPGFTGTETIQNEYNTKGQLVKITTAGMTETLYEYDELGNQIQSGLDVNRSGELEEDSNDRINETETRYTSINERWWQETIKRVYANESDGTPTTTAVRRSQLSGLGTKGKTEESVSIDIHGNQTTTRIFVDRDNKTATNIIDYPDSTIDGTTVSVNGRLASSTGKTGIEMLYGYDALGRRTGVTHLRTGTTATQYNENGQIDYIEDPAENRTSYAYAPGTGRRISETNALGNAIRYAYDDRGQLIHTWGEATYPVTYAYDEYGQKVEMHTYRSGENWDSETWPEGSTGTPDITKWHYDNSTGLLTAKEDAANQSVTYTYSTGGRLATRTWARLVEGNPLVTAYNYSPVTGGLLNIDYSDATPDITYTYDRLGRLNTVEDAVGTRTFAYNQNLQLESETITGLYNKVITRTYDTGNVNGRHTGFSLDSDYNVTYGYEGHGRFSSVAWDVGDVQGTATYSYLQNSDLLHQLTIPSGLETTYAYEPNRNLKTQVKNELDEQLISKYDYIYDPLGRISTVMNNGRAFAAEAFNQYSYNDRNELIESARYLGSDISDTGNPVQSEYRNYSYDPIGNRTLATNWDGADQSSLTSTYASNSLNQYGQIENTNGQQTTENLAYDADGNLTAISSGTSDKRYVYNAENRLISVEPENPVEGVKRVEFAYDYMGRRVVKKVYYYYSGSWLMNSDSFFIYDGWNMISEETMRNGQRMVRSNLWGLDLSQTLQGAGGVGGLLALVDLSSENTYQYFYDANGNVGQFMDSMNGSIFTHYEYDPYGNEIRTNGNNTLDNPYRFSTKYFGNENKLYYYGYRYYSTFLSRWLLRDPFGEDGGIGLYNFCLNDPIGNIDTLGLKTFDKAWGVLFSHWLSGRGRSVIIDEDDPYWSGYMKADKMLQLILQIELQNDAILRWENAKSGPVRISTYGQLDRTERGYFNGYQLLNATKYMLIVGPEPEVKDCLIRYDNLKFTWTDKIDPNFDHGLDVVLSEAIRELPSIVTMISGPGVYSATSSAAGIQIVDTKFAFELPFLNKVVEFPARLPIRRSLTRRALSSVWAVDYWVSISWKSNTKINMRPYSAVGYPFDDM